jgi:hypothetical protein
MTDYNATATTSTDIYYRLKMLELSGKYQYSPMAKLSLSDNAQGLSVYPNPFINTVTVNGYADKSGLCTIRMTDVHGHCVKEQTANVSTGPNMIRVDMPESLPPGVYQLKTDIDGRVESMKLVK